MSEWSASFSFPLIVEKGMEGKVFDDLEVMLGVMVCRIGFLETPTCVFGWARKPQLRPNIQQMRKKMNVFWVGRGMVPLVH